MWVRIGHFGSEYDAYFSDAGKEIDKLAEVLSTEKEPDVGGNFRIAVVAKIRDEDFQKVREICERNGLEVRRVYDSGRDEVKEYVLQLITSAMAYLDLGKADEAKRRISMAIRALTNSDGIADKIRAFVEASKENEWLKGNLDFWEVSDEEELVSDLRGGCWSQGVAFIWGDFCFAEQTTGGGEFAVFKYSDGKAFQFESISAQSMSEDRLREFLKRISSATDEQLKRLEY